MLLSHGCLVVFVCCCIVATGEAEPGYTIADAPVPRFQLDLDLPPKQRWQHILKNFDGQEISNEFNRVLGDLLKNELVKDYAVKIASAVDRFIHQPFADELQGVSEVLGIDLGEIVIFNLFYDIMAYKGTPIDGRACTSIVCLDKHGSIIHARNMDFLFSSYLRNFTLDVEYQRNGKTIYVGTHFAGLVGLATGSRVGAFTLTLNERDTGHWWDNLIAALEKSGAAFFFLRKVLEKAHDYDEALQMLESMELIAPAYFILGGVKPGEGAVVVGDRQGSVLVAPINSTLEHKWYVVETNYEPWNRPPSSDDRRDAAIKYMDQIGQSNMDASNLYKVLSQPPVLNSDTIYTTVMSASNSSLYHTTIRRLRFTP